MKKDIKHTPAIKDLLEEVTVLNNPVDFSNDLILIHDIALYQSDHLIDIKEKTALYRLKVLSDIFLKISEELK